MLHCVRYPGFRSPFRGRVRRHWQGLAELGHGAIQVVQLESADAGNRLVCGPAQGTAVRAGGAQAVQDSEEHRPFDIEAKAAVAEGVATAGEVPAALEDHGGPDDLGGGGVGVDLAGLVMGGRDRGVIGEAGAGAEEAVEGIYDLLADLGARPLAFVELEVDAHAVRFGADFIRFQSEGLCSVGATTLSDLVRSTTKLRPTGIRNRAATPKDPPSCKPKIKQYTAGDWH